MLRPQSTMTAPVSTIAAPIQSKRSGCLPSTPQPQRRAPDEEDAGVGGERPSVPVLGLERLDDGIGEEGGETEERQERW